MAVSQKLVSCHARQHVLIGTHTNTLSLYVDSCTGIVLRHRLATRGIKHGFSVQTPPTYYYHIVFSAEKNTVISSSALKVKENW